MTTDLDGDPELASFFALDDRPGPAARISRERALAMVETALAELPPPIAAPSKPRIMAGGGRTWLVAAGVLFGIVGGAAAARWYFVQRADTAEQAPAAPAHVETTAPSVKTPDPVPAPSAAAPLQIETVEPAEPAVAEPIVAERTEHGRSAPEDLLQKANKLRTLGRFRDAAQTYSTVSDRYPKTLSSYVSQVAAASIELEHLNNPARARRLFERALREHPEGALDLEARQGLATALRDLGQGKAEIEALHTLIDVHPGSPAAKRAALRLAELGAN